MAYLPVAIKRHPCAKPPPPGHGASIDDAARLVPAAESGGFRAAALLSLRARASAAVGARLAERKGVWLAAAAALGIVRNRPAGGALARNRGCRSRRGSRSKAALQFTFIGSFFSQVLPSTVGGDAARIFLLARSGGGWAAHATYSAPIDRIVGVTLLAAIVIACLPWSMGIVTIPRPRQCSC